MAIKRKQIGETLIYKKHSIVVLHCGPDLLCEVDGAELNAFYLTAKAAREAGKRYVDEIERLKNRK